MGDARKAADTLTLPWVVVAPSGVHWLGQASDEAQAWTVALGWPDDEEVAEHKRDGWYAAQATVTWRDPRTSIDGVKRIEQATSKASAGAGSSPIHGSEQATPSSVRVEGGSDAQ